MTNSSRLDNFYPATSYRRVRKRKRHGRATRYGPQSVASATLIETRLKRDYTTFNHFSNVIKTNEGIVAPIFAKASGVIPPEAKKELGRTNGTFAGPRMLQMVANMVGASDDEGRRARGVLPQLGTYLSADIRGVVAVVENARTLTRGNIPCTGKK